MTLLLNDKTVNGNTLTNNNGVAEITTSLPFSASKIAAGFTAASSQSLSASDSASLSITGNMTVEFWVKFTTLPSSGNIMGLVSKDNGTTQRSYSVYLQNVGGVYRLFAYIFEQANGTNSDGYWVNSGFTTGTWYHIAITVTPGNASATTFEFFIGGASQGNGTAESSANATGISDSTASLFVGSIAATNYSNAVIDELRIWDVIRTAAQINRYKSAELDGKHAHLKAYYPYEASIGGGGLFLAM